MEVPKERIVKVGPGRDVFRRGIGDAFSCGEDFQGQDILQFREISIGRLGRNDLDPVSDGDVQWSPGEEEHLLRFIGDDDAKSGFRHHLHRHCLDSCPIRETCNLGQGRFDRIRGVSKVYLQSGHPRKGIPRKTE